MADDKTPRDLLDWLGITDAPRWWVARPLGPLFAMVLALLLVLALVSAFAVLLHTVAMARSGANEGINLGAGALIVALLGAPFLIWSTVLKHQTLRYQKEGHITDRINKAVEQLGAEKTVKVRGKDAEGKDITIEETKANLEVRIGAILSLERIAQDSTRYDKGRDHVRVMEILCAYVRENAPASSAQDHPFGEWEPLKDDPTEEERAAHLEKRKARFGNYVWETQVYQWARTLPAPRTDIAIALRVIGRRTPEQRQAEARWGKDAGPEDGWVFDTPCPSLPAETNDEIRAVFAERLDQWKRTIDSYRGYRLDLRNTNLQRADLSDLTLSGARLDEVRMDGANLSGARVDGANLFGACMEGGHLHGVRMEGADLFGALLEGADLRGAWMQRTELRDARMEGADLRGVSMNGADLWSARMEQATLRDARMVGAVLRNAWMQGATLSGAHMEGAKLQNARLEGAFLHGAWLDGANLTHAGMERAYLFNARMAGANLTSARLEGVDLCAAQVDASTDWNHTVLHGASVQFVEFTSTPISTEQVKTIFGDATTRLPDTIPRPTHWPKDELDWDDFQTELAKWRADPATYKPPE